MSDSEHQAFLALFLEHQQDVRAYCYSLLRDWHACDDAVQEIAMVLWRRWEDYDQTRPFGAWARGVASRVLLSQRRKSKRLPVPLQPETVAIISEAFDRQEVMTNDEVRQAALRKCLAHLTPRARRLLHLRYAEELGLEAIAQAVEGTYAAVKKALTRSRASLADCLDQRLATESQL